MPPRYAYWTILIGNEPTAFRSGSHEDLMPTLKRIQQRHAEARMMWWQNGKLWNSRLDAQEAMLARGEIGRRSDPRQEAGRRPFKPAGERYSDRAPRASERREERAPSGKLKWSPKSQGPKPQASAFAKATADKPSPRSHEKPEWKPKGSFTPERSAKSDWKPQSREDRPRRPEWRPKSQAPAFAKATADKPSPKSRAKPEWKPKGSFTPERSAKIDWKPQSREDRPRRPEWRPKSQASAFAKATADKPSPKSFEKPEWKPKSSDQSRPKGQKFAAEGRESRGSAKREGGLEWKPKGESTSRSRTPDPGSREKRKWVPKEEYKKSQASAFAKATADKPSPKSRDKNWRPGGEHKDPRQKYKDAKKAKWGRFKQTIRKRWESKTGKKKND